MFDETKKFLGYTQFWTNIPMMPSSKLFTMITKLAKENNFIENNGIEAYTNDVYNKKKIEENHDV